MYIVIHVLQRDWVDTMLNSICTKQS